MTIPSVVRSRTDLPFRPTREIGNKHSASIDNFCAACGADLRVRRRLVTEVNAEDAHRLALCESAELLLMGGPIDELLEKELVDLRCTYRDLGNMAELFYEGIHPEVAVLECGLEGAELVGVTADGEFLYAECGLWRK